MRNYRDWQFFNKKTEGSYTLMQACYSGHLWDMGFGFDPARVWIGRFRRDEHKYLFHFHCYLPLAQRWEWGKFITYFGRVSVGFRFRGKWHNFPKRA